MFGITKNFLIREYVIDKKSAGIIASEIGCSEPTIRNNLKKFGIKIRTISESRKLSEMCRGKNHGSYVDGRSKKKYYCIEEGCNNEICYDTWRKGSKRCRSCCFHIKRVKVKCDFCGEIIEKIPSHMHLHNFCNTKCKAKWLSINKRGINSSLYVHGKGYEPYPIEFDKNLKRKIKKRDNYQCQNCGMTEEEHLIVIGRGLSTHHIDYNKQNCDENNLILLCQWCNLRANYNRNYWEEFFNNKIKEKSWR